MPTQLPSASQWLAAAKHRRTVYGLKGTSSLSDDRVEEILRQVLSFAPSSYNSQPVRISLVTGEKHKQFWDVAIKELEPIFKGIGEQAWEAMSPRFQGFKAACGSVVFWERGLTAKEMAKQHSMDEEVFKQFGDHASGMHQIFVWTALELEGLGANLQHLGVFPPVEAALRNFLGLPEDYKLKAHLNYGDEAQPHPEVPQKLPFDETLQIFK